ncbi:MAG: hypothetical protein DMF68_14810 [Acidobacteria bacterium]|nr:MAG: hypothetical protein DMF68_14810 [Acidobacteriota bacterium]
MTEEKRVSPRAFISYSWSSPQHEQWVLDLAGRLVNDSVDVILDKWELREGQDKYSFMERMVTDESVSKVLVICDKQYAEKANKRKGGVGTESQIISREVYEKVDQKKFIARVTEYDENGKEYVPAFFGGRIFIDMSTDEKLYENYNQLLRAIYDKPLHVKPALGTPPSFLFEDTGIVSKTAHKLALLKRAVQEDKSHVAGLVTDYLRHYLSVLEDFRLDEPVNNDFDDKVVASIERFLLYRDEFIDFIVFISTYREDERVYQEIFEFFQSLLKYTHKPDNVSSWYEELFDNYRFIAFELFIYNMTALINNQKFEQANIFLSQAYYDSYLAERARGEGIVTFCAFDLYPESLEAHRKNRLRMNVRSVTAELLRQRAHHDVLNFKRLIQTDFILYLRSILHLPNQYSDWWSARTVGYAQYHGIFELFAKSTSRKYFKNLMILLDIESKQDLVDRYKAAVEKGQMTDPGFRRISPEWFMNLDKLDTF